jgi:hypothetical protein
MIEVFIGHSEKIGRAGMESRITYLLVSGDIYLMAEITQLYGFQPFMQSFLR